jgi:hypothetical protein
MGGVCGANLARARRMFPVLQLPRDRWLLLMRTLDGPALPKHPLELRTQRVHPVRGRIGQPHASLVDQRIEHRQVTRRALLAREVLPVAVEEPDPPCLTDATTLRGSTALKAEHGEDWWRRLDAAFPPVVPERTMRIVAYLRRGGVAGTVPRRAEDVARLQWHRNLCGRLASVLREEWTLAQIRQPLCEAVRQRALDLGVVKNDRAARQLAGKLRAIGEDVLPRLGIERAFGRATARRRGRPARVVVRKAWQIRKLLEASDPETAAALACIAGSGCPGAALGRIAHVVPGRWGFWARGTNGRLELYLLAGWARTWVGAHSDGVATGAPWFSEACVAGLGKRVGAVDGELPEPLKLGDLRRFWQAHARGWGVGRGVVRGGVVAVLGEDAAWEAPGGVAAAYRVVGQVDRLVDPPLGYERVPRRAPQGVGRFEPEVEPVRAVTAEHVEFVKALQAVIEPPVVREPVPAWMEPGWTPSPRARRAAIRALERRWGRRH